jgi:RNA polymerase sigma factor (sigma-70 family)
MTKEEFDGLLDWLEPNRAHSGEKYEAIRRRLITVFLNRQCDEAEDLADETINRVAEKVTWLKANYVGVKERYFYGVARNVRREYFRQCAKAVPAPPEVASHEELEPYLRCLDQCLAELPRRNSELILNYYKEEKRAKIASHREMGDKLRLKVGALRARVFRIRTRLAKCILQCLDRSGKDNIIEPAGI